MVIALAREGGAGAIARAARLAAEGTPRHRLWDVLMPDVGGEAGGVCRDAEQRQEKHPNGRNAARSAALEHGRPPFPARRRLVGDSRRRPRQSLDLFLRS